MCKTNAMRLLDRAKCSYEVLTYATEDGKLDGVSVAQKLAQSPKAVFKTLVTRGTGGCFVYLLPVAEELDLKAAARAVGEKALSMLPLTELTRTTGYVKGGCSPLGMKKQFPTVFDASALSLSKIYFSGGQIGCQIGCAPQAIIALLGAKTADLCQRTH